MILKHRATIVLTVALLGVQAAAFAQSGQTQIAGLDPRFAGVNVDPSAGLQAPGGDAQTQPAAPQNQIPPAQTTDSGSATPAPAQPNTPAPQTQQQVPPQQSAPQNATPQMTPASNDQPSANTTPTTPAAAQQNGATQLPDSPAPQQTAPAAQQTTPTQPAGTAAAERARTRGGVASRPAGVAIAPAKQHQVRSILIKTGAILAGAAALGTVYALHTSTPSNPPGAANGIRR